MAANNDSTKAASYWCLEKYARCNNTKQQTEQSKQTEDWQGIDIVSTHGYDALVRRLKDGREMCKEVEEYFKNRAKIEEEYAKGIQRLIRSPNTRSATCSVKAAWEIVKTKTQELATEHTESCKQFSDAASRMSEFIAKQKNQRLQDEETVKKSMKKKADSHKKLVDTKKTYEQKSRENEALDQQINQSKMAGDMQTKDWDKLYVRQKKTKLESNKADQQYRESVDALDSARKQWEQDMAHLCNDFEQLEEDRLTYLRNELWVYSNIVSSSCVVDDKICEDIRKSLEKCDVDEELVQFINDHRTGDQKPAAILYECYGGSQGRGNASTLPRPNIQHHDEAAGASGTGLRRPHPLPPPPINRPLPPSFPVRPVGQQLNNTYASVDDD